VFKVTPADRPEFLAEDHTRLREIFHPAKHQLTLSYSLAHGTLPSGRRSKRHVLVSSEVYYFIAGRGRFTIDDQVTYFESGTTIYVPPGGQQFVENTGETDVEFLCIVEPAWRMEDETMLE
jgi:mannose-6-phosphate isomerase-like protein (cupin superfamily)